MNSLERGSVNKEILQNQLMQISYRNTRKYNTSICFFLDRSNLHSIPELLKNSFRNDKDHEKECNADL